ncbi:MAG TPA: polysaccharide deacetylase family protein [Candidatus Marinimicrobia bacterium]|nr:polysaccharide deacetylase family protein [Candidatus Neomarinimicrobiota bacterium]HRS51666.1 polysaccharide deacetylase family protein [Candidatus Neomarinimicrobiota bacterium]HRU92184.1 polysaccharide deacetylase family protein [Candidatus Neomarinimicrobiota bacterium]
MNKSLILAYHRILPDDLALLRQPLAVSTTQFERQMLYLIDKGWQSMTLSEYFEIYDLKQKKPDRIFVITFDDGYRDNYYYAFPILKKYNLKATIFVVTGLLTVPKTLQFDSAVNDNVTEMDYSITLEQMREMANYGIEFGSHTITHPRLDTIGLVEAEKEIDQSKRTLEQYLNQQVKTFCYPYGALNDDVIALVSKSGYQCAVVTPTRQEIKESRFTLIRVGVYNSNSLLKFKFKCSNLFLSLRKLRLWFLLKHLSNYVKKLKRT